MIRIPKDSYTVTGILLKNSLPLRRGDLLHITRGDFGYLAYDVTQNRYYYIESSLIHNENVFQAQEVVR